MAARKKAKKPSKKPTEKQATRSRGSRRSEGGDACLYLGCFFFDRYREDDDHTGTFQMVVSAQSPEQAIERFRKRLRFIHRLGTVLTSPSTVFLEGIVPLAQPFEEAVLVNYESRPSAEFEYQLTNMTPEQGIKGLGFLQIAHDDERDIQPFVDFGGKAHLRVLEAARKLNEKGGPSTTPLKPRLSVEERDRAQAEAAAQKARRAVEGQAKKAERQAAKEAKQRRDRAFKETLAELGKQR
jgi:hypothetical protein